jgi:hypothetical protein
MVGITAMGFAVQYREFSVALVFLRYWRVAQTYSSHKSVHCKPPLLVRESALGFPAIPQTGVEGSETG